MNIHNSGKSMKEKFGEFTIRQDDTRSDSKLVPLIFTETLEEEQDLEGKEKVRIRQQGKPLIPWSN